MDDGFVIIRFPFFIIKNHVINACEHHSGYGNDCFFPATPFCQSMIFDGIIRIFLAFYSSQCILDK